MVEQVSQYDELLAERARQFARLGLEPKSWVTTVVLEGDPNLLGREDLTRVLIILVPQINPQINQKDYFATMMFICEDSPPKYGKKYYYERVLNLVNPPVHSSFARDNILERLALEQTCARALAPSRMMEICREEGSGEEVIALHCAKGISPKTALEEIQSRICLRIQQT